MSIQYRSEHDSVGERSVPKDVYYGVQSLRAAENFPITGLAVHPEQINSIAEIKKASAITNLEIGLLDTSRLTVPGPSAKARCRNRSNSSSLSSCPERKSRLTRYSVSAPSFLPKLANTRRATAGSVAMSLTG